MAKRRFKRASSRRSFFAPKRKRSGGSTSNPIGIILPAMAYGAGRQYLTQLAAPITSKIPLGNYADEVVFGTLGYFLAKKNKGMIGQVGRAMLTVEAASAGSQLLGSMSNGGGQTQNSGFVYG
jgi:hypothetical protein